MGFTFNTCDECGVSVDASMKARHRRHHEALERLQRRVESLEAGPASAREE